MKGSAALVRVLTDLPQCPCKIAGKQVGAQVLERSDAIENIAYMCSAPRVEKNLLALVVVTENTVGHGGLVCGTRVELDNFDLAAGALLVLYIRGNGGLIVRIGGVGPPWLWSIWAFEFITAAGIVEDW